MKRSNFSVGTARRNAIQALSGVHMLAFLPALCLAAYWTGGEILLVSCALAVPLFYALTGGFGTVPPPAPEPASADLLDTADGFLKAALHNGQTTACFQIALEGLDDLGRTLGCGAAAEAKNVLKGRLISALRESDRVFEGGSDRFIILLAPGFRMKLENLLDIARRLREAAEEPLSVSQTTRNLSASVGIASSLTFGRNITAAKWIDSAGFALDEALASNAPSIRVWSDKLSRNAQFRTNLRADIDAGLDTGSFVAHFQPQISLHSGRATGLEILARWHHPARGLIEPREFIPALEDSGQMSRLGATMLDQATEALFRFDREGRGVDSVSLNLSAQELRVPDLAGAIGERLDRLGLAPRRLVLEIGETTLFEGDDMVRTNLREITGLGCRLDIDNFGTGHASLLALQQAPISRIKLDRTLVRHAHTIPARQTMLSAICGMAETMGIETLAAGVETIEEQSLLRQVGCRAAQGFLFAHSMPVDECGEWLAQSGMAGAADVTDIRSAR
ncbi:GGDEF domain-containing phosphodiesterase [Marivita sp. GX14005]|uniref:GGDEF domain-containing phosphodiesterase n=1 Tax=Marivita sp. GX14005 TaxID=2942276 RepID=UPI002018835A|nr:GGDEF domain-containing phosphodiesterase [Marivita sp. GX14005]MCL3881095.1 GGDEF domain-containing phosphodiesterase [Marivita sp. GX14005]